MRNGISLSEFGRWAVGCFIEDCTRVIAGACGINTTSDRVRVSSGGLIHGGDLLLRKDRIARQS